jgi:hypothetical protein
MLTTSLQIHALLYMLNPLICKLNLFGAGWNSGTRILRILSLTPFTLMHPAKCITHTQLPCPATGRTWKARRAANLRPCHHLLVLGGPRHSSARCSLAAGCSRGWSISSDTSERIPWNDPSSASAATKSFPVPITSTSTSVST